MFEFSLSKAMSKTLTSGKFLSASTAVCGNQVAPPSIVRQMIACCADICAVAGFSPTSKPLNNGKDAMMLRSEIGENTRIAPTIKDMAIIRESGFIPLVADRDHYLTYEKLLFFLI